MSSSQPSPSSTPPLPYSGNGVTMCVQELEKTPAAIRDALDPAQREQFEAEYQAALARAAGTFDLEPVLTLVRCTWWVRAMICLNPEMIDGVATDIDRAAEGHGSVFAGEGRLQSGREGAHESIPCPACLLCH